ncbi:GNAT family N-acetyltransferase [Sphingomonas sp. ASV193]|uniref:GNAT family N-acetyltransferase n=1 Tax=Sphingomonas sp. ASV193 TaxID=3144405 RepID=UPI0032E898AB
MRVRREFHRLKIGDRLTIRRASEADFPAWADLLTRLHPAIPASEFTADIAWWKASGDPFACFFAEAEEAIVGFIDARVRGYVEGAPGGRAAFVEDLWVDEAHRRSGIAAALLDAVERWACDLGLAWLGSDTVPENTASQRWHLAHGFSELERLVVYGKSLDQKPNE